MRTVKDEVRHVGQRNEDVGRSSMAAWCGARSMHDGTGKKPDMEEFSWIIYGMRTQPLPFVLKPASRPVRKKT